MDTNATQTRVAAYNAKEAFGRIRLEKAGAAKHLIRGRDAMSAAEFTTAKQVAAAVRRINAR